MRSLVGGIAFLAVHCFACIPLVHGGEIGASVVRVRAIAADGALSFGSGVYIATQKVATACHVTRNAVAIEVQYGSDRWHVENQIGSVLHDLCLLTIGAADLPIAQMRSTELRPGERLAAAGFQGDHELVMNRGVIAGLYRFDGGNIIRTTAAFDFGSSGGGLFDEAGNLVGILAFKGRAGKNLRFALPTEWLSPVSPVADSFVRIGPDNTSRAFWEQTHRPAFLGVAIRDAANDRWSEMQ